MNYKYIDQVIKSDLELKEYQKDDILDRINRLKKSIELTNEFTRSNYIELINLLKDIQYYEIKSFRNKR